MLALLLALLLMGPFAALIQVILGDSGGLWAHLFETVFPRYTANTLILMTGVAILSLSFGVVTAWIVARHSFFGVHILDWALLLPATVPSYIIAYTYTDLLEFAGPIQSFLRQSFGWSSVRDYWFPEIRSMGGAMLVMSAVLYPYIYIMARTAFRLTPASYIEVAQLSKLASPINVDLLLARPAIIAGLALVLMEVLSDFGTVEFFAVETLTLGIFNIWLGMNNLTAAAQIAAVAFIFILVLLSMERWGRRHQRFFGESNRYSPLLSVKVRGRKAFGYFFICIIPLILGFIIPVSILLSFVVKGYTNTNFDLLLSASIHSILVALVTAGIVISLATIMVSVTTFHENRNNLLKRLANVSVLGYAFPGVILAIGVVSFAGAIDKIFIMIEEKLFVMPFESFLIGSVGLLIFGCVVRFQAVGHGAIKSGVQRLSPNIVSASYVLGCSFSKSMVILLSPLLRKSMLAGGMLVFVDVMKELPMTLLLRPFNYETLSTYVYQFAKDELLEETALAALMIILVGIGPVILMHISQRK